MKRDKKPSLFETSTDNLASMPKSTAGQRVKYLLKKYGMTQKELARKLFDGNEDKDFDAFYINLNTKLNSTPNDNKRNLTYDDAKRISELFNTTPQYILDGGYENNAEMLQHLICETEAEADLLHVAFRSLSTLAGYNVQRIGYRDGTLETIISSLYDYAEIEHNGKTLTLSIEQLNELENIIYEHAEITIRRYLESVGKEVR